MNRLRASAWLPVSIAIGVFLWASAIAAAHHFISGVFR